MNLKFSRILFGLTFLFIMVAGVHGNNIAFVEINNERIGESLRSLSTVTISSRNSSIIAKNTRNSIQWFIL